MDGELTPEMRRLWLINEIHLWSKASLFTSGIMIGLTFALMVMLLTHHSTRIVAVAMLLIAISNLFFDWAWHQSIQDSVKEIGKTFQKGQNHAGKHD